MRIILAHNHYDTDHLNTVEAEMANLGAPVIKAVWVECYNAYVALEGCHRLRAAHNLGIEPEIDEIEISEDTMIEDLGLDLEADCTVCDFIGKV